MTLDDAEREAFEEAISRYESGYTYEVPEVFLACIPKARILGPSFLVGSSDGRIFSDSIWGARLLDTTAT